MPVVAHRVAQSLRPYVAAAHAYRVPAAPTGVHRGLPSRSLTLVLELAAPLRVQGERASVAAHAVAGGLHTSPALVDARAPQDGVQYALTPLGARAVLGAGAAELRGHVVDLADVGGRDRRDRQDWRDLVDRLARCAPAERLALVDELLLRRLAGAREHPPAEVREAWRLIGARRGDVRVAELAQHVGWSRRHLGERFRDWTGVTPKEAARVARFEAVRAVLGSGADRPPLAELAVAAGYADQSHLAREWQAFCGCSITTWLREELPYVQDPLDGAGADSAAWTPPTS